MVKKTAWEKEQAERKKRTWEFLGRYGDSPSYTIHIKKLPDELDEKLQKQLIMLYVHRLHEFYGDGTYVAKNGYDLRDLGLVYQVGKAWYPGLCWAPQVHEWMHKRRRKCHHDWMRCHIPSVYDREIYCRHCGIDLPRTKKFIDPEMVVQLLGESYSSYFKNAVDVLWNEPITMRERKKRLQEFDDKNKQRLEAIKRKAHEDLRKREPWIKAEY